MAKCKRKRFAKQQLCIGDLRHKIEIVLREQQAAMLGQKDPTETLTTVFSPFAAIQTIRGSARFNFVNTNKKATHLFTTAFTPALNDLDYSNNFIRFKTRLYKVLEITNQDEDNQFLIFQCSERGAEDKEASKA